MEKSYRLTDSEAATILTLLSNDAEGLEELAAENIDNESSETFQKAANIYRTIYNKIEKEFLNR